MRAKAAAVTEASSAEVTCTHMKLHHRNRIRVLTRHLTTQACTHAVLSRHGAMDENVEAFKNRRIV